MAGYTDYTGQTLEGRYTVDRLLGRGGMGSVYLGRHNVIGRKVAVKFLHASLAQSDDIVKRFYREAQAVAAIGHKHIIEVLDVGVSPFNEPFIVMEYLEGESLSTLLERVKTLDLPAACGVLEPVLLGLQAAHDRGIVHRDLKPDNIFVVSEPGGAPSVKLIDFGISKVARDLSDAKLTQTGTMLGTPSYMSPEQARGSRDVDHRADIYAMGVVLYEMLSGGLPFEGENYNELLITMLTTPPRPPSTLNPAFPAEAEPLVLRCLSKDPADRPRSAIAMLDELKALSAFAMRADRLTHFAAGVSHRSFASGDLGGRNDSQSDSTQGARNVLESMRGTPGAWAGTVTARPRRSVWIGVAVAGLLAVGAAIAAGVLMSREQPMAVVPVQAAQAHESNAQPPRADEAAPVVQITVHGAPQGATILYENTPVPSNPFPVDRKQTMARLEIKAPGYEPFVTSVVPKESLVVQALLTPLSTPTANKAEARPRAGPTPKAEAVVPPKPGPEREDKKRASSFKAGKRGTLVGTEFE